MQVETSDHARLMVFYSVKYYFEFDEKDPASLNRMFSVPDYIGFVAGQIASRMRAVVAQAGAGLYVSVSVYISVCVCVCVSVSVCLCLSLHLCVSVVACKGPSSSPNVLPCAGFDQFHRHSAKMLHAAIFGSLEGGGASVHALCVDARVFARPSQAAVHQRPRLPFDSLIVAQRRQASSSPRMALSFPTSTCAKSRPSMQAWAICSCAPCR
jgi:hypothetical protein